MLGSCQSIGLISNTQALLMSYLTLLRELSDF